MAVSSSSHFDCRPDRSYVVPAPFFKNPLILFLLLRESSAQHRSLCLLWAPARVWTCVIQMWWEQLTLKFFFLLISPFFFFFKELHRRGGRGIVQDAVLIGTPVTGNPSEWRPLLDVVAGQLVNAFSRYKFFDILLRRRNLNWIELSLFSSVRLAVPAAGGEPKQQRLGLENCLPDSVGGLWRGGTRGRRYPTRSTRQRRPFSSDQRLVRHLIFFLCVAVAVAHWNVRHDVALAFWFLVAHFPLVVVVGHGDYRTKADQCLKAIALLRVIPITTTTTTSQQQSQVRTK